MPDEIARLSEALARDPAGMGWVPLADALRRARRLPAAERTALRGLERHPYHADGHDVLARIAADSGDLGRARDEWEMALRLEPRHVGARLGLGWLSWRIGDRDGAMRWWQGAREIAPQDARVVAAGRQLQAAAGRATSPEMPASTSSLPPASPAAPPTAAAGRTVPTPVSQPSAAEGAPAEDRSLFAPVVKGGARFALLADADGLVLAGTVRVASGGDHADLLAAELSGLSDEARRALRQLQLGAWEQVLIEGERTTLAVAPSEGDTVTLVATPAGTPAGLPRLLLDRARQRASAWLESL